MKNSGKRVRVSRVVLVCAIVTIAGTLIALPGILQSPGVTALLLAKESKEISQSDRANLFVTFGIFFVLLIAANLVAAKLVVRRERNRKTRGTVTVVNRNAPTSEIVPQENRIGLMPSDTVLRKKYSRYTCEFCGGKIVLQDIGRDQKVSSLAEDKYKIRVTGYNTAEITKEKEYKTNDWFGSYCDVYSCPKCGYSICLYYDRKTTVRSWYVGTVGWTTKVTAGQGTPTAEQIARSSLHAQLVKVCQERNKKEREGN